MHLCYSSLVTVISAKRHTSKNTCSVHVRHPIECLHDPHYKKGGNTNTEGSPHTSRRKHYLGPVMRVSLSQWKDNLPLTPLVCKTERNYNPSTTDGTTRLHAILTGHA